jgi:hypothetical protein
MDARAAERLVSPFEASKGTASDPLNLLRVIPAKESEAR